MFESNYFYQINVTDFTDKAYQTLKHNMINLFFLLL